MTFFLQSFSVRDAEASKDFRELSELAAIAVLAPAGFGAGPDWFGRRREPGTENAELDEVGSSLRRDC